jgi:predicted nucleic acid-binding protein
MARIYLDANVFISYIKREMGFNLRGLFIETERFFETIKKGQHTLVLSPLFFDEVERKTKMDKKDILEELENLGVIVELINIEILYIHPYTKLGVPRTDAMHIAYATQSKCTIIVTFNIKDFKPAERHIKIVDPATLV